MFSARQSRHGREGGRSPLTITSYFGAHSCGKNRLHTRRPEFDDLDDMNEVVIRIATRTVKIIPFALVLLAVSAGCARADSVAAISFFTGTITQAATPEPPTILLVACGIFALAFWAKTGRSATRTAESQTGATRYIASGSDSNQESIIVGAFGCPRCC
jgi:hypothetical protein